MRNMDEHIISKPSTMTDILLPQLGLKKICIKKKHCIDQSRPYLYATLVAEKKIKL